MHLLRSQEYLPIEQDLASGETPQCEQFIQKSMVTSPGLSRTSWLWLKYPRGNVYQDLCLYYMHQDSSIRLVKYHDFDQIFSMQKQN